MGESNGKGNFLWNGLQPVAPESSGLGLPYAPENWPEKGDIWGWRTGRRVVSQGTHFHDRYLYLPKRLAVALKQKNNQGSGSGSASGSGSGSGSAKRQCIFASKLAVERYVKTNFPDADLHAFFASFCWKIPAISSVSPNGNGLPIAAVPLQQIALEESESNGGDVAMCEAKNKNCISLVLEEVEKYSPAMPCDICCTELEFCRDCSCILCSRTVSSAHGGYSYIKCQVQTDEGICAHTAHLECALRCLLAGKVGGSIGLDAEYYCRRCDGRTDMISHVNNLLQTCKTADLDDEILKKILNLSACLLRGSEKPPAKELFRRIELAISKLKSGDEDIWKEDDSVVARPADQVNDVMEVNDGPNNARTGFQSYDSLPRSLKLEADVDHVLRALRRSQEFEYNLAEETLQAQKTYLKNLYDQQESETGELAGLNPTGSDISSSAINERNKQIKREEDKFELMKEVANGFARTSNDVIKKCFDLEMVD